MPFNNSCVGSALTLGYRCFSFLHGVGHISAIIFSLDTWVDILCTARWLSNQDKYSLVWQLTTRSGEKRHYKVRAFVCKFVCMVILHLLGRVWSQAGVENRTVGRVYEMSQWYLLVELCRTVALWRLVLMDDMRNKDVVRGMLSTITQPHTTRITRQNVHKITHMHIYLYQKSGDMTHSIISRRITISGPTPEAEGHTLWAIT